MNQYLYLNIITASLLKVDFIGELSLLNEKLC